MEYTVCTFASFIHHKASVIVFQLLSCVQLFVTHREAEPTYSDYAVQQEGMTYQGVN